MRQKEYIEKLLPLAKEVLPMAYRLLGNDVQAEDVVQEVMLTLWNKRKTLQITTSHKSFLYKSVKNKCLDVLKKKKSIKTQAFKSNTEPKVLPNDEFDTMHWIHICINQLPDLQKQIICMREIDGLKYNEISELLQLKEPHIRMLLSRAKKTLRITVKKALQQ